MTTAPESTSEPSTAAGQLRDDGRRDGQGRLGQVAAGIGIIAGVVFIVAVIFFSGVFLARSTDGYYWWGQNHNGGHVGSCPMMTSGDMMGPGGHMGPR